MADNVVIQDGKVLSEWQQPINKWMDQPGSIHNDAVAAKVGMRGGTIPGTVHLDHFVPIIQDQFGPSWYEKGSISMYYTYATTHREDVRAGISRPAGDETAIQVDAWVETPDGKIVAKGTIALGTPDADPYVRTVALENAKREDLRILADLSVGDRPPEKDDVIVAEGDGPGDYQGMLIYPATMYQTLNAGFPLDKIKKAVGFFGATQIELCDGPIKLGIPYTLQGAVVCVGASPKTEFAWVDSHLVDKGANKVVARMRHLTRWMKVSSPLWQDAKES